MTGLRKYDDSLRGMLSLMLNPDWPVRRYNTWPRTTEEEMDSLLFSTDYYDAQDSYVVEMDIPGLEKEDIKIEIDKNVLTVGGERKIERKAEHKYFGAERASGKIFRTISLPGDVSTTADIGAEYNNGVLKITIPKAEEKKAKTITVA